jgi:VanZ family protein
VSAGVEAPPPAESIGAPRESGVERRWWRWGIVFVYALAIFWASSRSRFPVPVRFWDKGVHAGVYAVLSLVIVWASVAGDWRKVGVRHVVGTTLACVAYGWSDEIHQLFVPRRHYDLLDLAADATGAVGAAVAAWAWGIIQRGNTRPKDV